MTMNLAQSRAEFGFASDNYSGTHPVIMEALIAANSGHQVSYGKDDYSDALDTLIKTHCGARACGYPVFNGTGANIIALSALTPRYGAVICSEQAHIHNDEGNAPAYVAGVHLVSLPTHDGKLRPEQIEAVCLERLGNVHAAVPTTVYLSQVTELGTCYRLDELRAIVTVAERFDLSVYVDGARLANACAYLDCTLRDIADTGIDLLSLGGTKNGLMMGECLIALDDKLNHTLPNLRKNHLQLASKHRFISAQFVAWLSDDLWLKLARHTNDLAQMLYHGIKDLKGVHVTQAVESNALFAILSDNIRALLHQDYHFYDWHGTDEVRLMMSFDHTQAQVAELIAKIRAYSAQDAT